jgi:hypothetical protein
MTAGPSPDPATLPLSCPLLYNHCLFVSCPGPAWFTCPVCQAFDRLVSLDHILFQRWWAEHVRRPTECYVTKWLLLLHSPLSTHSPKDLHRSMAFIAGNIYRFTSKHSCRHQTWTLNNSQFKLQWLTDMASGFDGTQNIRIFCIVFVF